MCSRDVALSAGRWALPATVSAWFWWGVLPGMAGGEGVIAAATVTVLVVWVWRHPTVCGWSWWSAAAPSGHLAEVLRGPVTLMCRAGLGPPRVVVRVAARGQSVLPVAAGQGRVVVPRGLVAALATGRVSAHEAAAGLCHAAAVARCDWVTKDQALRLWCLPWLVASSAVRLVGGLRGRWPGVDALLRARLLLFGIAAVQAWQAGGPVVAMLLVGVGVMSYLQPVLERSASARARQVGDRAVAEAGLGEAYLRLLERVGRAVSVERQALLNPASGAPARCAARV